ncbi:MAG: sensor domain-containing diguanylate cyclase [Chloroflexi bacterium]|nr:MAG: sensor domain-containing diguanylate cyclase [Chloroflexota bacterium]
MSQRSVSGPVFIPAAGVDVLPRGLKRLLGTSDGQRLTAALPRLRAAIAGGAVLVAATIVFVPRVRDTMDLLAAALLFGVVIEIARLAVIHERTAARATLYQRVARFAGEVHQTLEPEELARTAVKATRLALPSEVAMLVTIDPATGTQHVLAMEAQSSRSIGASVLPDPRVAERAIREGRLVVEPTTEPDNVQRKRRSLPLQPLRAAVPIFHRDRVLGALVVGRLSGSRAFDVVELECLALIAVQLGQALGNVQEHALAVDASVHDPLTGLYNRRHLHSAIERMTGSRADEGFEDRRPMAAILFDLDHFGRYNKEHGHLNGDEILRLFGRILDGHVDTAGLAARYGGEEFLVLLKGRDLPDAVAAADAIRLAMSQQSASESGGGVRVTVSAGCAVMPPAMTNVTELIALADEGLRRAKLAGRDRVAVAY